ncbi:nucleoside deaminase [Wohlfahrtiimonas larvae]|uniref:Nucleoside deaminase n=1 Tax=Wohlfahrtiimonas larvae TaxID=1157986 RepID=A0ABP9N1C7_9GAMM|nr:nucleoside deaminase [Wohlfahrtiimonas larvae]
MHHHYLKLSIELAAENVKAGGQPFGSVIVKEGKIIATGVNHIARDNDPTAHAELVAIRAAGQALNNPDLSGCVVYASGEPCPMCQAAMFMAGIHEVYYAYSSEDGAPFGFSTEYASTELQKTPQNRTNLTYVYMPETQQSPNIFDLWVKHAQG